MTPKALLIAPSAYPLGGVAVWLDYLAAGLPAHGWEPLVGLVSGPWHDLGRYRAAYPQLPVLAIDNPTGSVEGRTRALMRAIERARPDIVVGVNIVDLYSASQRLKSRGRSLRTVMSLHGIAADLLGDMRRESSRLDAVIATNRLACKLCVEHAGMPSERVLYAPYGVDTAALSVLPRPAATDTLSIAWVGRLEQDQKRVEAIPAILQHLDQLGIEYVLRIAGDGPDRASLLAKLEPWMQSGHVDYLGALPAEEVGRRVYAQADIFLLTSSWETGPIVVWEAMAAGLAVVSTRYVGSALEGALKHGENCLMFALDDASDAANQLARVCDTRLRKQLARAGRRLVEERYAIDHSVSAWAASLNNILHLPVRHETGPIISPQLAGRLDRLLGASAAETMRSMLGLRFVHSGPGGEWPHTAASGSDEKLLLRMAREQDVGRPLTGILDE
jgi:glycosyltransferase involved in cell wall biosynthesis